MNGIKRQYMYMYVDEKKDEWSLSQQEEKEGISLGRQPQKNWRTMKKRRERRTATSRIGQPWKTVALNWRAPFLDAYCAPPRAAQDKEGGEEGFAIVIAGGPRGVLHPSACRDSPP